MVTPLANIKRPIAEVCHAELSRFSEESDYKSDCPIPGCQGILLVSRPLGVFALNRAERCTLCGQAFWYTDESVGGESFLPDQPRHLTPEILAYFNKVFGTIEPPTLWDRLGADSERPER
jgi:hypothetical protein